MIVHVSHLGIYGYNSQTRQPFLKITVALPRLVAPCKRLLEQGFQFSKFSVQGYKVFESNVDFEIRCVDFCTLNS